MAFNTSITLALPNISEFTSPAFKQLIYSHLTYLRITYRDQMVSATAHQGIIWQGDLYGLLLSLGISYQMLWVVSAINGFDDPCDYDGTIISFIVPTERDIVLLLSRNNILDSEPR